MPRIMADINIYFCVTSTSRSSLGQSVDAGGL